MIRSIGSSQKTIVLDGEISAGPHGTAHGLDRFQRNDWLMNCFEYETISSHISDHHLNTIPTVINPTTHNCGGHISWFIEKGNVTR